MQTENHSNTQVSELQSAPLSNQDIMRLYITQLDMVKNLSITTQQLGIIKYARDSGHGITASELAGLQKITLQNASVQLTRLWNKGYLKRSKKACDTGGHFFHYEIAYLEDEQPEAALDDKADEDFRVMPGSGEMDMSPEDTGAEDERVL